MPGVTHANGIDADRAARGGCGRAVGAVGWTAACEDPVEPLDDIRIQAARQPLDVFREAHPDPALVLWQVVEGDLQFAARGELVAEPRAGDTLVHVPRVSARERMRNSLRPGRREVARPRWFPVRVRSGEEPLRIGRERGNDLRIRDFSISATHALIWGVPSTPRRWVEDADSRNGTLHNGVSLVPGVRSELQSGDELVLGQFALLYLDAGDFHRYLTGRL